jgi:hypothetical protein
MFIAKSDKKIKTKSMDGERILTKIKNLTLKLLRNRRFLIVLTIAVVVVSSVFAGLYFSQNKGGQKVARADGTCTTKITINPNGLSISGNAGGPGPYAPFTPTPTYDVTVDYQFILPVSTNATSLNNTPDGKWYTFWQTYDSVGHALNQYFFS